jgi:hypothetical protein
VWSTWGAAVLFVEGQPVTRHAALELLTSTHQCLHRLGTAIDTLPHTTRPPTTGQRWSQRTYICYISLIHGG